MIMDSLNPFKVYQYKSYEMYDSLYKAHDIGESVGDYSDFYRLRDSLEYMAQPNFPRIFFFPDYEFNPNDFK